MARSEARLKFGIWRDGLDGLAPHARLLYVVLLTEPTVNHCGVGAVRPSKWATNAGLEMDEMQTALEELVVGRYVVIDDRTEEILVRTMIRNDGVADQPNVLKGAIREALQTESPMLRRALAAELRKLPAKGPDGVSKSGRPVVYPDPHVAADELDPRAPKPPAKPMSNPSGTLLDTPGTLPGTEPFPNGSGTLSTNAQNPSRTPGGGGGGGGESLPVGGSVSGSAQKRGTRVSDDFTVSPAMAQWAKDKTPHVDGRRETEKFINYWMAKSGKDAAKVDWVATWRNWMLNAEERSPHLRIINGRPVTGDGVSRDPKSGVAVER
jgi:hypothetical protein